MTQSRQRVGSQSCDDQRSHQDPLPVPLSRTSTCPHPPQGLKVKARANLCALSTSDCLLLIMSLRQHTHTHAKAHLGETRVCLHFSFMLFVSAGVWDETFWPLLSVTIIVITGESSGWTREAWLWLDSLMMSSVIGSPSPCNAVSFQEKNKGLTFLPAVP